MKYFFLTAVVAVFFSSCKRDFEPPVPVNDWSLFLSAPATSLPSFTRNKIEGIYTVRDGSILFGNQAAMKWSYTKTGADTVFQLSLFSPLDAIYIILEGRRLNNDILLNGYWRRNVNVETGKVRLTITAANGATALLNNVTADSIILSGVYGNTDEIPEVALSLKYLRPLRNNTGFEILAHRGGGRNADLLPASENSLEMIRLAAGFGATGVEIDVHQTRDGELILYHDATLNERLIVKNGMVGPIENYSYAQLDALVQLKRGGKIPTLRQALQTILFQTPLRFVWLDTKLTGSLENLRALQKEFIQIANANGRQLQIFIGVPTKEVLNQFTQLPAYRNIPSLSELDVPTTESINANIWAPTWTQGLQTEEVNRMQAQGRSVITWTLDGPDRIDKFLNEGSFNGILSNQPSAVAYYFYAKQ